MSSWASGVVPGCSGACTVKCCASSSRNGSHARPQGPWKKTSDGPRPFERTRMRTRSCQTAKVRSWTSLALVAPTAALMLRRRPPRPPRRPAAAPARRDHRRRSPPPQALRPPVIHPALVVPDGAQARQHLAAEELDVLERKLVRHRADLQEHHKVADV